VSRDQRSQRAARLTFGPGAPHRAAATRSVVEQAKISLTCGLNHITAIAHDETTCLRAMLALRLGRLSDRTQLQEPGRV
jgi:hypothetical protein